MSTRVPLPLLVRGTVKLPEGAGLKDAMARVQLLDTTYADAPSVVLAETVISNVENGEVTEFELRAEVPADKGRYTVSAHVKPGRNSRNQPPDFDEIERGDLFNTQSYPVELSADQTAEVEVEVHLYGGAAEPQRD